jgi:hypothetical protein
VNFEEGRQLSEAARAEIVALRERQQRDPRVAVAGRVAYQMLGTGATRQRELIEAGELASILDGASRRILVSSIYDYLVRRIVASYPLERPPAKARRFLGKRLHELEREALTSSRKTRRDDDFPAGHAPG